ncbi:MAG: hypothetical protein Q8P41_17055 [Pseudomonadota bacterium]|nr:hypothetical protein [Pseudomonadota bacterium]
MLLLLSLAAHAEEAAPLRLNTPDRGFEVRLAAELGFAAVLSHIIQFDRDGTEFDYVRDGGQDVLFPFARLEAGVAWRRSHVVLLYQPLLLQGEVTLQDDLVVDDVTFAAGTPIRTSYDFPYFRGTYLYDLLPDKKHELSVGVALQLRNATISFQSLDGETLVSNRNVGPVPVLAARYEGPIAEHVWWGAEATGFYAPIKYLNGDDNGVVGAILDASVRIGLRPRPGVLPYVNVRYIGGGSEGTSDQSTPPGDGYNNNWIHAMSVSVGTHLR